MGVIFDYFIAPDDGAAAAVIDRVGGPGSAGTSPARDVPTGDHGAESGAGGGTLPTVADAGFDPVVQATTLEALLTRRAYDDLTKVPGWGRVVASRDGGEQTVVAMSSTLVDALASVDDATLSEAVVPWSQTEEFWGAGDPDALLPVVRDLAGLARRATPAGHRMYCWVCV